MSFRELTLVFIIYVNIFYKRCFTRNSLIRCIPFLFRVWAKRMNYFVSWLYITSKVIKNKKVVGDKRYSKEIKIYLMNYHINCTYVCKCVCIKSKSFYLMTYFVFMLPCHSFIRTWIKQNFYQDVTQFVSSIPICTDIYIFLIDDNQKLTFSWPWLFLIAHLLVASFWEDELNLFPSVIWHGFPYLVGDSSCSFLLPACDRYFFEEDESIS